MTPMFLFGYAIGADWPLTFAGPATFLGSLLAGAFDSYIFELQQLEP